MMTKNEIKELRKSNFLDVVTKLHRVEDECEMEGGYIYGDLFSERYCYYPWELPTIEVIKLLKNKGELKKSTTILDFLKLIDEYCLYDLSMSLE